MKKDRNTFFEGSSMNMAFSNPNQPMMPMGQMPMTQAQASQSFYSNTGTPMTMVPMYTTGINDSTINELESRMAKLERSINRLENRLNKLEGTTYYTSDTSFDSNTSGMYMV